MKTITMPHELDLENQQQLFKAVKDSLENSITEAARSFSPAKGKGYAEHIVFEVEKSVSALRLKMGKASIPLDEIRRIEEASTGADYSRKFALRLAWRILDVPPMTTQGQQS